MADEHRPGPVHWIDHFVVGTNDMGAWIDWAVHAIGVERSPIGGLTTAARKTNRNINCFLTIGDGSCHFGAFLQPEALPPSAGLGKGTPRNGFYIRPKEIDEHVRRLDAHGIPHTAPRHHTAEGEPGTAIYFQDPDENEYEFWAPDQMPDGAMEVCTAANVGRISSLVLASRDLQRTAAFFAEFCSLEPDTSDQVPEDTLVLPLATGGRIVFKLTPEVDQRSLGHRPRNFLHTALLVRSEDYFAHYERLWDGLPEEEQDGVDGSGIAAEEEADLPARTGLHGSPAGRRWKATFSRGDGFYDWDTHAFHFFSGASVRADGSLAVYKPIDPEDFLREFAETPLGKSMAKLPG